jgi:hypothetical protein
LDDLVELYRLLTTHGPNSRSTVRQINEPRDQCNAQHSLLAFAAVDDDLADVIPRLQHHLTRSLDELRGSWTRANATA